MNGFDMNGRVDGWMEEQIDKWKSRQINGTAVVDGKADMEEQINEWKSRQVNGSVDR